MAYGIGCLILSREIYIKHNLPWRKDTVYILVIYFLVISKVTKLQTKYIRTGPASISSNVCESKTELRPRNILQGVCSLCMPWPHIYCKHAFSIQRQVRRREKDEQLLGASERHAELLRLCLIQSINCGLAWYIFRYIHIEVFGSDDAHQNVPRKLFVVIFE